MRDIVKQVFQKSEAYLAGPGALWEEVPTIIPRTLLGMTSELFYFTQSSL